MDIGSDDDLYNDEDIESTWDISYIYCELQPLHIRNICLNMDKRNLSRSGVV
jgi:hypothetical protein